jgi:hypothetical protein
MVINVIAWSNNGYVLRLEVYAIVHIIYFVFAKVQTE